MFNIMCNDHAEYLKSKKCPCFIIGDFNLNLLNYDNHRQTAQFIDNMFSNSFIPLINRPTRITQTTATLIDTIFSNNCNINNKFYQRILTTDISDHYIIFHIWEKENKSNPVDEDQLIRQINSNNINKYKYYIASLDWSCIYSIMDSQLSFSKFLEIGRNIYKSFPKIKVKKK